ncbi:hypothetical protein CCH79_00000558 [Gambusia affinis]|uniref:Uncharacterized protein n=1 Tax=Gambusia affinis TaxID=33528 RepID=A0A315VZP5_GAMAF|nr:hypothetical protein CCH79_00000558 [Gambusia affinis]
MGLSSTSAAQQTLCGFPGLLDWNNLAAIPIARSHSEDSNSAHPRGVGCLLPWAKRTRVGRRYLLTTASSGSAKGLQVISDRLADNFSILPGHHGAGDNGSGGGKDGHASAEAEDGERSGARCAQGGGRWEGGSASLPLSVNRFLPAAAPTQASERKKVNFGACSGGVEGSAPHAWRLSVLDVAVAGSIPGPDDICRMSSPFSCQPPVLQWAAGILLSYERLKATPRLKAFANFPGVSRGSDSMASGSEGDDGGIALDIDDVHMLLQDIL